MSNVQETIDVNTLLAKAQAAGMPMSAPIDVDGIAHFLGIKIVYRPMVDNDIVGQIAFIDDQPVVTINPMQNSYEPRRRFTLAHEIGHYCLHSASTRTGFTDSRKTMSRSDSYWDPYESEANSFAAQLLMPEPLLLQAGNDIIGQYRQQTGATTMPQAVFLDRMASKFEVSSKAMEYRLKNLKLIS